MKYIILIFWISSAMSLETPKYKLLEKESNFEIREYSQFIIAKTIVENDYEAATSTGFRRIANYIFGGNNENLQIPMTAPVISTSPSILPESYEVMFFMPSSYSLSTLPKPNMNSVKIQNKNLERVGVIKFGGWATRKNCSKYHQKLEQWLNSKSIKYDLIFMVAQYNSPWALPPFRKNEIFVKIIK
tara:strand:- start:897 stop:1457 length:561 start_codon:yes stop_codon:yes gene_type:complete